MKRCPECGGKEFNVFAHVVQDWLVGENGEFISCTNSCVSVAHYPDDEDLWECDVCGYDGPGRVFNVDE